MYPSSFSYYCLWYSNRWNQISGRMTHYMIENVVSCFSESKMTVSQPLHFTPSAIKIAPFPCAEEQRCCSTNPRGQRLCLSSHCILGSQRTVSQERHLSLHLPHPGSALFSSAQQPLSVEQITKILSRIGVTRELQIKWVLSVHWTLSAAWLSCTSNPKSGYWHLEAEKSTHLTWTPKQSWEEGGLNIWNQLECEVSPARATLSFLDMRMEAVSF